MIIRYLKWSGVALVIMALLFGSGYLLIARHIEQRISKAYSFDIESLDIPVDSATMARGKHLVAIKGCQDCHEKDLSGKVMINDPAIGRIVASNLTTGDGGLPDTYTVGDWLLALRHGVDKNGKPLLLMPSHETTLLSADDLAAIIAYCSSIPPVNHILPNNRLGPMGNLLTFMDKMPMLSVEKIDHDMRMRAAVDTAQGVELGKYLAISCSGCHRSDFKGGDPVVPGGPKVADLTRTGNIGKWTEEQFIKTLRTGVNPDGHHLKNEDMPWKMTAQYEDKELISLFQYFQTL